jgi:putative peptidoglycan lipid II flippase
MSADSGSPADGGPGERASVLGSSAVMAAGTVVSRLSGFVRTTLLAAALGTQLHADVFNIANTIPNMLYILLAGGIFNAVLVPQLIRAMKNDADGGEGYTNRIITLAALFLAGVTAVLVVAAPLVMRLFLDGSFYEPGLAAQRESVIDFARYCLPQVFFYGMFVLVGQVLNARGSFGPMMWAPIANNVIAVAVLVAYLLTLGAAEGSERCAGYDPGGELLLGLGSTVGIAVQLLVLLPYLRKAGFRFRPRFDFRGTGLGHTLRLGIWTVLFVVVNQIAYTVVVRLASSGTAAAATGACASGAQDAGTGYTVYSTAFLLIMVPHSIATVSLATAILPRLSAFAADGRLADLGRGVAETLRTTYAVIIPFAALLPVVALDVSNVLFKYGAASATYSDYVLPLSLFAIGLVFFTAHYLVLRGFYALEMTRAAFWVQTVIAGANIVLAVLLTRGIEPAQTAPRLVLAYSGAYAVGAVVSYTVLRRVVGGLQTPRLARFAVRMVIAVGISTAVAAGVSWLLREVWTGDSASKLEAVVALLLVGAVDLVCYLALARLLRLREVTDVVGQLTRRLAR